MSPKIKEEILDGEISWEIRVEGKVPLSISWGTEDHRFNAGYTSGKSYIRLPVAGPEFRVAGASKEIEKLYYDSQSGLHDVGHILDIMVDADSYTKAKTVVAGVASFYEASQPSETPITHHG